MIISEQWLREFVNPDLSTEALAEQLTMAGLEVDAVTPVAGEFSGVLVAEVAANSAASAAGLREGDIIVQLGYSRIDDSDEYRQVIGELPERTPIAIRFYRQGRAIFRTIQID